MIQTTSMTQSRNVRPHRREGFDPVVARAAFPIFATTVHGHPLVYLDNAATTQKPQAVIDAIVRYYTQQNANIHRAVHHLGQQATDAYEAARRKAQRFLNAPDAREVIFVRGTTEAINLVAHSWCRVNLRPGDEVLVTAFEHHSNIVPWQLACEATGATLRAIPMGDDGALLLDEFERLLSGRTKFVAVTHLSNALGTKVDVKRIARAARRVGAKVLVDGAQWVGHFPTDVQDLGCDFYCFSGHKLFGPTGVGVLWGREELLREMPPYQGGGDMIATVTFGKSTYNELPYKFEAGTPDIAGAIGLGAAIDYLESLGGVAAYVEYERQLHAYLAERLTGVSGVRIVGGETADKAGVVSFVINDPPVGAHDVGVLLDGYGVAVRTGHHCCQPLMDRLGVSGTVRASLAFYNTHDDVDRLIDALEKVTRDAARRLPVTPQPTEAIDRPDAAVTDPSRVDWPMPVADSPDAAAREIIESFDFLGEWEQRHEYLLDLGGKIPPMPVTLKSDANLVKGCQSTVHLATRLRPGTDDVLDFVADSDAHIVRGLIALLQRVFAGQQARKIVAFDVAAFLRNLGLDQHLSMGRRNGLEGMVRRIKTEAARLAEGKAA